MSIKNYGELIAFAKSKKLIAYQEYGSYQGDYIAVVKKGKRVELWKGHYGSCSGCDWLAGQDEITKEEAQAYLGDEKPFLVIDDRRRLAALVGAPDIQIFFPANTRNDYDDWDWEGLRKLLKEAMEYELKELKK